MRIILTILSYLIISTCHSQPKEHICDSGYSYMPTLGTSSLWIKADTCLPDIVVEKLWKSYRENMCGEIGFSSWAIVSNLDLFCDGCLGYDRGGNWNDTTGICTPYEYWTVWISGVRLNITREQYDEISKSQQAAYLKKEKEQAKLKRKNKKSKK